MSTNEDISPWINMSQCPNDNKSNGRIDFPQMRSKCSELVFPGWRHSIGQMQLLWRRARWNLSKGEPNAISPQMWARWNLPVKESQMISPRMRARWNLPEGEPDGISLKESKMESPEGETDGISPKEIKMESPRRRAHGIFSKESQMKSVKWNPR